MVGFAPGNAEWLILEVIGFSLGTHKRDVVYYVTIGAERSREGVRVVYVHLALRGPDLLLATEVKRRGGPGYRSYGVKHR